LLGHLHELALASGVSVSVDSAAVPAIPGVLDLLALDEPPIAGGTRRNREWVEEVVSWSPSVNDASRWLLCDAMTSGGLLVALSESGLDDGLPGSWARVGKVSTDGPPGSIRVT
jgi:selenide,water dikinase